MRGWYNHDREWEIDLVQRLRRGGTVEAYSLGQLVSGYSPPVAWSDGGWEAAEEHAKHAIRSGAVYLNDEAIAARKAERDYRKKEMAEALAANKAKREREEARRRKERIEADRIEAIEAVERARVAAQQAEVVAARRKLRAEQDAAWRAEEARALAEVKQAQSPDPEVRTAAQFSYPSALAKDAEAEQRRYWAEQSARRTQEYEIRLAAAKKRQAERAAAAQRPHYGSYPLAEAQFILGQKWGCGSCGHQAQLKPFGGKYMMTCKACKTTVVCEHAIMLAQIRLRQERGG